MEQQRYKPSDWAREADRRQALAHERREHAARRWRWRHYLVIVVSAAVASFLVGFALHAISH